MKISPDYFARLEYRDHVIFRELARTESNPDFKRILEQLSEQEYGDYQSWLAISEQKEFSISSVELWIVRIFRKILGLTFVARYLKRREDAVIHKLEDVLKDASPELREHIISSLEHERANEEQLLAGIKEEQVEFTSSIILGLNDGLIELTGALVGFSFALHTTPIVAMTGSITGIAASLSMSASAYMQARHDESGKNPRKAALYTGISYFVVVVCLIAPFLLTRNTNLALGAMFAVIGIIITVISYYTAVIFARSFGTQFKQMVFFSLGVAGVALVIGTLFRRLTGIAI
jgi:vacuolar iron transporter family protein